MKRLLINCDLGEWEPAARTRALMRTIDLANVACGGHAGNVKSMERCVRLAAENGVRLGAHPGDADPASRGRGSSVPTSEAFALLLVQQIAALETIARGAGVELHHVKLHGSLYHLTESNANLRNVFLDTMRRHWPNVAVIALAGGRVLAAAEKLGLKVLPEIFADRAYRADGRLLSRALDGALIQDAATVRTRLRDFIQTGSLAAVNGRLIRPRASTVCVHGDTPGAVGLARAVREALG